MKINLIGAAKNSYHGIKEIGDALDLFNDGKISAEDFADSVNESFMRFQPQACAYAVLEVIEELT